MKTTKYITRAAVILALTIALQFGIRAIIPVNTVNLFFVGSIVNLGLLLATETTGLWAGVIIAFAAPLTASLQGHLPLAAMIPAVMAGNLILVIVFWLVTRKGSRQTWMRWIGLVIGAAVKMAFLYYTIGAIVGKLPGPAKAVIMFSFSWPQFVTAVIGGILSTLIARRIKPLT